MSRPLHTALAVLALGAALAVIACDDGGDDGDADAGLALPERDPELVAYLGETFGLVLSGWSDAELRQNEDGFLVSDTEGLVDIEGIGERTIALEERIEPAAQGGEIFAQIRDVASGEQRFFLYNYDEGYIVFGEDVGFDDSRGVGVQQNPDGTYEVWTFDDAVSDRTETETVPDGYAAMRRVDEVNRFSEIQPHVIMTAFALGHTETPEARFVKTATSEVDPMMNNGAFTPAACSIFKEFCDCVACRVLERDGDCALCPQL